VKHPERIQDYLEHIADYLEQIAEAIEEPPATFSL
jgi:hypothetical protein